MSDAISGVGAQFLVGDGASNEQFTKVAEVASIGGPNITRTIIDVTSLDSTGGYMEFKGGLRDGGSIDITANFTRDGYDDLKAAIESDSAQNFRVSLNDAGATQFDFAALISALGMNTPINDKVSLTASFKITGTVTLTS